MNIINPNFQESVPDEIELHRAAVLQYVQGVGAGRPRFSFDEVRAALEVDARQLPDGYIQQICQDANIRVVP